MDMAIMLEPYVVPQFFPMFGDNHYMYVYAYHDNVTQSNDGSYS